MLTHAKDAVHVTRPFPSLRHWAGDKLELAPGLTAHRLGGHFPGSSVLLWSEGERRKRPLLFSGDTIMPTPRGATFMYAYPNLLPLPAAQVRRMRAAIASLDFIQLRSAFAAKTMLGPGVKESVLRSADLYVGLLTGEVTREYF